MTIRLGGIDLNDHLVLYGLDADRVAVDEERSDEGVKQLLLGSVEGGRNLELEGRFTIAQDNQIRALSAGLSPVLLEYPQFTGQVYISGSDLRDEWELNDATDDYERIGSWYLIEA